MNEQEWRDGGAYQWIERAYGAVAVAMVLLDEFTADDVWAVLEHWKVPEPVEASAMGSTLNTLRKRGVIEKTGAQKRSERPASRSRKITVYRATQEES